MIPLPKRLDTVTRANIQRILNLYGEKGVPGATLDDQAANLVQVITGYRDQAFKPAKFEAMKARVMRLL